MPSIYEILFGHLEGVQQQVCCPYHDDVNESAGISSEGQFHCFTCGSEHDASGEVGFIKDYFGLDMKSAAVLNKNLHSIDNFKVNEHPVTDEQRLYLINLGITNQVINDYFVCASNGKLMFKHRMNGYRIGYTWFNGDTLSNYSAGYKKYCYQNIMKGGMPSPYDSVKKYNTLYICEGEKDFCVAQSMGIQNIVAKIGGAQTQLLTGFNFNNKNVVIIYDCDDAGRKGAEVDANELTNIYNCKVKVVNLGLQDKEDLTDYFIKYGKSVQDLYDLIKATPLWIPTVTEKQSAVDKLIANLSKKELNELTDKLIAMRDADTSKKICKEGD